MRLSTEFKNLLSQSKTRQYLLMERLLAQSWIMKRLAISSFTRRLRHLVSVYADALRPKKQMLPRHLSTTQEEKELQESVMVEMTSE